MPKRIGKTNNIEKFDSEFFNISAIEANLMDPGARIMLEHTYEAIIDAGVNPKELQGTKTCVFLGNCYTEAHADIIYNKPRVCYFNNTTYVILITTYVILIIKLI